MRLTIQHMDPRYHLGAKIYRQIGFTVQEVNDIPRTPQSLEKSSKVAVKKLLEVTLTTLAMEFIRTLFEDNQDEDQDQDEDQKSDTDSDIVTVISDS